MLSALIRVRIEHCVLTGLVSFVQSITGLLGSARRYNQGVGDGAWRGQSWPVLVPPQENLPPPQQRVCRGEAVGITAWEQPCGGTKGKGWRLWGSLGARAPSWEGKAGSRRAKRRPLAIERGRHLRHCATLGNTDHVKQHKLLPKSLSTMLHILRLWAWNFFTPALLDIIYMNSSQTTHGILCCTEFPRSIHSHLSIPLPT